MIDKNLTIIKKYNYLKRLNYDFLLEKFVVDYPEIGKDKFAITLDEFLKYISISTVNSKQRYTISGPIDNLWHCFILDTRKYRKFCKKVNGGFIDHIPADISSENYREIVIRRYNNLKLHYKNVFGVEGPRYCWPKLDNKQNEAMCAGGGCSRACDLAKDP